MIFMTHVQNQTFRLIGWVHDSPKWTVFDILLNRPTKRERIGPRNELFLDGRLFASKIFYFEAGLRISPPSQ
ncbi:hypothetical protein HJA_09599 [Hyphomonas jannaschiana VP2]|uniref:Uncharacterized protein n=1 Tax=Hyphomonas jannaschiana VP2 TaxID=1280952 RepID=A0A059FDN0_9PROT|nr:hypothetical protein HJA_09599 [Hyphomonas jannaschiana VP2]